MRRSHYKPTNRLLVDNIVAARLTVGVRDGCDSSLLQSPPLKKAAVDLETFCAERERDGSSMRSLGHMALRRVRLGDQAAAETGPTACAMSRRQRRRTRHVLRGQGSISGSWRRNSAAIALARTDCQ